MREYHDDWEALAQAWAQLLRRWTDDPEVLQHTPNRAVRAWQELLSGEDYRQHLKTFPWNPQNGNTPVRVKMPIFSVCEHHLLPFLGDAEITYWPHDRVLGLSKLYRVVQALCRRPQLQERLTQQIAQALYQPPVNAQAVMVRIRARHLCVEMRGTRIPYAWTQTEVRLGTPPTNPYP